MPSLKIREEGKERFHQIEGDVVTVGRSSSSTVPIGDGKASKEHCRIERSGDRWKMVDLESKNGTRVNGDFRNRAWLEHGDTIQIGATEIRFGLEGATRRAAPAPVRAAETVAEDEGAPPPPRRYARDKGTDRMLIAGLSILAIIIVVIVANTMAKSTELDKRNLQLLEEARKLERNEQYDEAIQYLQDNADPGGNAYPEIQKYIRDLETKIPVYRRNKQEVLALKIVSKLSRKIRAYHKGAESATAADILQLVEKLKTDYAATDQTKLARKEFEVWFKGIVPERAVYIMGTDSKARQDWQETVERAQAYRKDWRFREARETVERFLATRAAVLDQEQLEYFERERDVQLRAIDQGAEGIYYARERVALDLVRNKRYDQAVAVYREIIEKFGIDLYVRKAQAEIEKIQAMKPQ